MDNNETSVAESPARFIVCTIMELLFCMVFVAGITLCAIKSGNWMLMWFYLLPTLCYLAG